MCSFDCLPVLFIGYDDGYYAKYALIVTSVYEISTFIESASLSNVTIMRII